MRTLTALTVFIIFLFLWTGISGISSAASFSKYDIEWDDANATNGTLYRGDSFTADEYTIKAVQFFGPVQGIKNLQGNIVPDPDIIVQPSVNIEIYKNGTFLNETILKGLNDPYIDPDYEYRVYVVEFLKRSSREWVYEYYKPWANVVIEKRAKPELEVKITPDKDPYTSYSDSLIRARVNVINKGGAFIKNVDLNLSIGDLKLISNDMNELHKSFQRIDRHSIESFNITMYVPQLTEDRTYVLGGVVKGYDAKGLEYTTSNSSDVNVKTEHYFHLTKSARDRIYLSDNDTVKILASNGGVYNIYNITIQDSINENFALEENSILQNSTLKNSTLEWNIPSLKPGQEWETSYKIIPLKTNLTGFKIPKAISKITVNNRPYKVTSEEPSIIVNGPIIVLNKVVEEEYAYPNENVTVTVTINNIGNTPIRAEVKDSIPEGVSLISGETSLPATFLELNAPQGFSYTIRRNTNTEGIVQLPPAAASYTDLTLRGEKLSKMLSNTPNITFLDTSKPKPASSKTQRSSGQLNNTIKNNTQLGLQKAKSFSTITNNTTNTVQPTPMVPGFKIVIGFSALLFAAALRRRQMKIRY